MRIPAHHTYRRRKPTTAQLVLRYLPRLALWVILLYAVLTALLVRTVRVDTVSMRPALEPGDRVLASPLVYGTRLPGTGRRLPGIRAPGRGDVVVVLSPPLADRPVAARALDALLRFATLQKVTLWPADTAFPRIVLMRVVGLPGETVRVTDYVAWVRPSGTGDWTAESSLGPRYTILPGPASDGGVPFGGTTGEISLGHDQYFLLGDNRAASNDSRTWGAVGLDSISARVLVRYYPFRRLGRL